MKDTEKYSAARERALKIVRRMSIEEKVAQLGSIWAHELMEEKEFSQRKAKELLRHGIGHITRPSGVMRMHYKKIPRFVNSIQRFLVENTHMSIPAIVHEECLCGLLTRGATIFPQPLALACAFDPSIVREISSTVSNQLRRVGAHQGLSPVADITRDHRWGRNEESFGEDPYLVSVLVDAYVKGFQGIDLKKRVIATLKHFIGYSVPEAGLNCAPARVSRRELLEDHFLPFETAVRSAGAMSVMNAYNDLEGVPCACSRELLNEILREQWGFKGIVVSDYDSVDMLRKVHFVAEDKGDAAKLALKAGVDIELPRADCYGKPLMKLLEQGQISEEVVDRAATRVITVKVLLGIVDDPYVEEDPGEMDTEFTRTLSYRAASESIVLLKNENALLPLDKESRIALIGPNAASWRNILGDYAFPATLELRGVIPKDDAPWSYSPTNVEREELGIEIITVLKGMKDEFSNVNSAQGCDVMQMDRQGFEEARNLVLQSDLAVMVMGERSGYVPGCSCGEGIDRHISSLPGLQEDLIKEVASTGKPVVLVLTGGRPPAIGNVAKLADAIIFACLPGQLGGKAIAEVISGKTVPSGKLPVSLPASAGQSPVNYARRFSAARGNVWRTYADGPSDYAYSFGHGLSYTTFEFDSLSVKSKDIPVDGSLIGSFFIKNTGHVAGQETVQLYVRDLVASVTRPVKSLKAFKKLYLSPGEHKRVIFDLPAELLLLYDKDLKMVIEPGEYELQIGSSSEYIRLKMPFRILGEPKRVDCRTLFFSELTVEDAAEQ